MHVDAYRLGSAAELDDLDLDFDGAVVVVEWGDGLLDGIAESWIRVRIDRSADERLVTIEPHGPRWVGLRSLSDERSEESKGA